MDFGELDFSLEERRTTPEMVGWRNKCRAFVATEILPLIDEWECKDELARECLQRIARFGYIRFHYPKRLGGLEIDPIREEIAFDELAQASRGARAYMLRLQRNYSHLLDDGQEEHREMLMRVLNGEVMLAFAETEAAGGSDAANIFTSAVPDDGGYRINGRKSYISLMPGADVMIVTALTDPAQGGKRGMSLFLVPSDAPGVKIIRIPVPEKAAWHTLAHIEYHNVWVPSTAMLGEKNRGFYLVKNKVWARRGLDHRLTPQEAKAYYFDECVRLLSERMNTGRRPHEIPEVRNRLVESFGLCEMYRIARLRSFPLFEKVDRGERTTGFSAIVQLFTKVVERRMMLNRVFLEAGYAVDADSRSMKDTILQLGLRAAGGGVDVYRIMLGEELYGREWNVARD